MTAAPARRSAWSDALAMLARRDLTEGEVRARLDRRNHDGDAIEEAVRRLRARRFLDDSTLAREVARSRAERRLDGPAKIRAYLRRRGLPDELVRKAVREAFPEGAEARRARAVVERVAQGRHLETASGEELRRLRERLFRRLLSRGYSFDAARTAVFTRWDETAPDTGDFPGELR